MESLLFPRLHSVGDRYRSTPHGVSSLGRGVLGKGPFSVHRRGGFLVGISARRCPSRAGSARLLCLMCMLVAKATWSIRMYPAVESHQSSSSARTRFCERLAFWASGTYVPGYVGGRS